VICLLLAILLAPPSQTWATCITGPGAGTSFDCAAAYDTDRDLDVDLRDVATETNWHLHSSGCPGATKEDLLNTLVEIRRVIVWPVDGGLGGINDYSCTYNQYMRLMQVHELVVRQLLQCERASP
jgi:hypothetical protein